MPMRDLLAINQHLNLTCHYPTCQREVRWTCVEAVERLGPDFPMERVRFRLRCSACGARGRDGFVSAKPCTLDQGAWWAREKHAQAAARGETLPWSLEGSLAMTQKLLGGREMGGDGPVQWPVDGPSNAG